MVSNSSSKSNSMTCRRVASTPNGQRLATAEGHYQGKESSLQAEVTGILSASVFVALLRQYRKFKTNPLSIIFVSNNLELIRKESSHKKYNNPYTNTTLSPEFDVLEQTYLINKTNKTRSFYSWIKGHQDDDEEEDLPLLVQLNIKADRIAGQFQNTNRHY